MNIIIESSLKTLQKSRLLLSTLTDAELSDATVSPYYSSIGTHLRHIFDFYDCVLKEENNRVDLTARKRDTKVENCCESAQHYLEQIIEKLNNRQCNLDASIIVTDDLGMGKIDIKYTYSALLAQANSHTIHHYAIINYILDRLHIEMDYIDLGYNPTTPKVANFN